jgi:hypothetical protein
MRKANLLEAGFEESEAEESIPLYDSLDDSAFEAIVAAMKKKMAEMKYKMKKEEKEEKPMATETVSETKAAEAVAEEVTEELFQEVQTTEATLVDASDVNDELEAARASVAEWLTENVLRK